MSNQVTTLYVILGAAVRGLLETDETPEGIHQAVEQAITAVITGSYEKEVRKYAERMVRSISGMDT